MTGGRVQMGPPRVMVAYRAGTRPSKDKRDRTFLREGAMFLNFVENVLCIGTGKGGWVEYELTRRAVISEDVEPI